MNRFNSGTPIEPPRAGPSRSVKLAGSSRFRQFISFIKAELSRPSLLSTTSSTNDRNYDGTSIIGSERVRPTNYRTNTTVSSQYLSPGEEQDEEGKEKEKEETIYAVIVDGDLKGAASSVVQTSSEAAQSTEALRPANTLHGSESRSHNTVNRLQTLGRRVPGHYWMVSIWRAIYYFFDSSFEEPSKEKSFQKDQYYGRRNLSIAAATFYLVMWAVFAGLTPRPLNLFDKIAYIGCYGLLSVPILIMVLFNIPYRYPWIWQIGLFLASWILPDLGLIEMLICNFFGVVYGNNNSYCADRTEFVFFAAAIGQQTLAIIALGQNRFFAALGFFQFFVLMGAMFFGRNTPYSFYRDVLYFLVYSIILLVTNFISEQSARQLFEMRDQLKLQYKATQKAQVLEKKASDLTKRFVSYIFHEVRVPLNTALLSVQNLVGEGTFKDFTEDQNEMIEGLTGSLAMMEKVLNDVLSFNRMESGRLALAKYPFDLNKSVRLTILSHSISAQTKGLTLDESLDPEIDSLDCQFIGDEMRLRQIMSNLISNAVKFTQTGGVKVVTRLVSPPASGERSARTSMDTGMRPSGLGATDLEKGSVDVEKLRLSKKRKMPQAVVRVEVHDTGTGFRKQDLVDDRLFSPYVQTEIGRRQGGKGTGLGLALVRQIVQLSHGRLGVDSTYGRGMIIWFEIPYNLRPNDDPVPEPTDTEDSIISSGSATKYSQSQTNKGSFEVFDNQKEAQDEQCKTMMESPPTAHHDFAADKEEPKEKDVVPQRPDMRKGSPSQNSLQKEAKDEILPLTDDTVPKPFVIEEDTTDPNRNTSVASINSNKPSSSTLDKRKSSAAADTTVGTGHLGADALNALVVDDDKLTRTLMSRMVKRLGHKTTTAENGRDALDKILKSYEGQEEYPIYDVIFLDNQMPLMSGVELASEVRSRGFNVYIVGCTGNALLSDQEEYLSAGADQILTKPIKQAAVEECIRIARQRRDERKLPSIGHKG